MHLGSLESTQEARVALGYRLVQLLRIFRTLQTSRVHPQLDTRTLSMNKFLNFTYSVSWTQVIMTASLKRRLFFPAAFFLIDGPDLQMRSLGEALFNTKNTACATNTS